MPLTHYAPLTPNFFLVAKRSTSDLLHISLGAGTVFLHDVSLHPILRIMAESISLQYSCLRDFNSETTDYKLTDSEMWQSVLQEEAELSHRCVEMLGRRSQVGIFQVQVQNSSAGRSEDILTFEEEFKNSFGKIAIEELLVPYDPGGDPSGVEQFTTRPTQKQDRLSARFLIHGSRDTMRGENTEPTIATKRVIPRSGKLADADCCCVSSTIFNNAANSDQVIPQSGERADSSYCLSIRATNASNLRCLMPRSGEHADTNFWSIIASNPATDFDQILQLLQMLLLNASNSMTMVMLQFLPIPTTSSPILRWAMAGVDFNRPKETLGHRRYERVHCYSYLDVVQLGS